jgi:hypothetical protein
MTDTDRVPMPPQSGPQYRNGQPAGQAQTPSPIPQQQTAQQPTAQQPTAQQPTAQQPTAQQPTAQQPTAQADGAATLTSVEQTIALREQAPEMYDLWLKIAKEKAATANYVQRAPYEVPERLAHSGRPRALGALVIVLSFCGYLAWLGGPGPYIGGLIALADLVVMFGMFFGLRPDRLPDPQDPPSSERRLLARPLSGCTVRLHCQAALSGCTVRLHC